MLPICLKLSSKKCIYLDSFEVEKIELLKGNHQGLKKWTQGFPFSFVQVQFSRDTRKPFLTRYS